MGRGHRDRRPGAGPRGLGNLDGPSQTLSSLYKLPSADFHDITTGSNGYPAGVGYDLVTGIGSPIVNKVVADLSSVSTTPGVPTILSFSANPTTVTAGTPTTLTVSAGETGGPTITGVNFYLESDGSPGLEIGSDTAIGAGTLASGSWTVSAPTAGLSAGTHTFYAVATDSVGNTSTVASTTITVTIPAGGGGKPVQGLVAAWDTANQYSFGTQNMPPTTIASGVKTLSGLTRGPNIATTPTAANSAWGGDHWAATASAGITNGQYVTFGFTVKSGFSTSLASISMNYYRNGTGPTSGYWEYSVNGASWSLIGNYGYQFANSGSASSVYVPLSGFQASRTCPRARPSTSGSRPTGRRTSRGPGTSTTAGATRTTWSSTPRGPPWPGSGAPSRRTGKAPDRRRDRPRLRHPPFDLVRPRHGRQRPARPDLRPGRVELRTLAPYALPRHRRSSRPASRAP